jgi:GMP synthase (glutamine-hydrolysing)
MDKIAILDFGGQYSHLIGNRIRKIGVYTEILDPRVSIEKLKDYKGIVLSGGPASVHAEGSLQCDPKVFELGIPILAICYGHQLLAHTLGGKVEKGEVREYGSAELNFNDTPSIFEGLEKVEKVWMSHFDQVTEIPEGFKIVASTKDCNVAAMINEDKKLYSIQFHPEVTHTKNGIKVLENFTDITGAKKEWNIDSYVEDIVADIKTRVGDKKVFLMISGGVDSTVAFLLLSKALGNDRVYGLFVDTGFMRKDERSEVEKALIDIGVENLHVYDASDEYFEALDGVYEPEEKRKIIGNLFIDIQSKVSDDLNLNPEEWFLAQGTIYPDTIETGGSSHSHTIKTHHNQVERILKMKAEGKVIEPLDQLYKDEVRLVGKRLGLNDQMVWRHPFPGPGLAVRTLCSKESDKFEGMEELEIEINEVAKDKGLKAKVLAIKSVGVQGDERTYRHPALLYGETKNWDDLDSMGTRLINQFAEINRVLLSVSPHSGADFSILTGHMTRQRILLIQNADKVVMDFISAKKIDRDIWQFPTVMIPVCSNGKNEESIVLRPVCSTEAMTANFYRMDFDLLAELSKELEAIDGVGAVFYDITNKPPGTIEWE